MNNRLSRRAFMAAALLAGCGGGDVHIPLPPVLRTDLHFCYYLTQPGQIAATADHTSLVWDAQFFGLDYLQRELAGMPHRIVMDCEKQLFVPTGRDNRRTLSPNAEPALRAFFADLRERGLLSRVAYLVAMDEPNLFVDSGADFVAGVEILQRVAAEQPELAGVGFMCIYGAWADKLHGLHLFDVVGINNYSQGSGVLTDGAHADLMRQIAPHQQVMVIPGAAYDQDPSAFVAYAHSEPRCWGVVPFTWLDGGELAQREGWRGLSVQSEEAQQKYREAGTTVLNRKGAADER